MNGSDNKLRLGSGKMVQLVVAPRRSVMVTPTEENRLGHLMPGEGFEVGEKEAARLIRDGFALPADTRVAAEESEPGSTINQNATEAVTVGRAKSDGSPSVTSVIR